MSEYKLPDVGEGLTEAEIVTWRVAVGDAVAVNDIVVDIETAKSIVELPSPYAGVVTGLLVEEGQTVPVGTPIISIADGVAAQSGDPAADAFNSTATAGAIVEQEVGAPVEERQPVLVGYGPRSGEVTRRRKVAEPVETTVPTTVRALAKPPVRKLAKDLGVDLADVPSSGPVITRADIEAFVARNGRQVEQRVEEPVEEPVEESAEDPGPAVGRHLTPTLTGPVQGDVRIPIKGVRKWTAEAMVASAFTAPHVTEWITVDVSRTVDLVERLRRSRAFSDVRVSPTLIVAKAVCLAMRNTPELNAQWDEENQEIVLKRSINLGIAAATDRGLVVPKIFEADRMTMLELAHALDELTETARAGKAQPAQLSNGSFTITNVGVFGVDAGTPIINPGESGILCVGAIERRPWVDEDDQIVPRWVTTLALSFDHRVVDGEQGSRFLADVAAILRDPATALTY